MSVSPAGKPPVLLPKANLDAFEASMRDALGDPGQRVVGVVYNAVDDHLAGADQLRPRWSLDDLQLMQSILHEARSASRVIVLTADHGHVLDHGTVRRAAMDGQRWRRPDGKAQPDEVDLALGRVLTPAVERIAVLQLRLYRPQHRFHRPDP